MHFHEVHEFIFFDQIEGQYFYSQGQSDLEDKDIVFTPALETHDFELTNNAKSWFILQILPDIFKQEGLQQYATFFQQGMHLRLDPEQLQNIQLQVKWLLQSYQQDPVSVKSITLLKLLIIWIAEHAKPVVDTNVLPIAATRGYDKLQPVINKFRYETVVELTLTDAAKLCHLSPSYFSRLFKQVFRYSFSEYMLRHKLYSAARLLSRNKQSITDISYDLYFSSPSHFIAQFKRLFGTTPLQFQKQVLKRLD
ncbi:helix-turn-helix transcriptional regulator [Psychrosphaera sp. F3M07]|nr:helix-turn-helix transcriptional regulator [Psychrosphaera sp. F3M07]